MKKIILFLLVILFAFSLSRGKSPDSSFDRKLRINYPSDPCAQQFVHRESNLWLTITNWGLLGSQGGALPETGTDLPAPSAHFPGGSELNYLFMGAIWVGGVVEGETLVSVGTDGWLSNFEMLPDVCPDGEVKKLEKFGDQEFIATYTDTLVDTGYDDPYDLRFHKPLKVKITQHSYSWVSSPFDDFIILDYQIKNFGDKFISKAYIGFYMDTDIYHVSTYGGWLDDITGFIEKKFLLPEGTKGIELAWSADNNGDLSNGIITSQSPIGAFGFALLGSSNPEAKVSYNWWVSEGNDPENLDFGPWNKSNWDLWRRNYDVWCEGGKGTPCGDRAKYFLMSNGEVDYDQIYTCVDHSASGWLPPPAICADLADGYDTRFLYSFGPFDISPQDSINFAVGIIMGDSLHRGENPFDNMNPQIYYSNLDFNNLLSNVLKAKLVYESNYTLPPPGPPKDFIVLNSTDSTILLSWSPKAHPNLKGYDLYRSSKSGEYPSSPINSVVIQDTFFLDKGIVEGDTYYYAVSCVSQAGKTGKKSEEIVILAGQPNPPSGLSAFADKEEICLSWRPNLEKDVVAYRIYRKEEGGEYEFIKGIGLSGLDSSYCDRTIENGVVYYYAVSAVDSKGLEGYLSNSVYALSLAFDQGILLVDMSSPAGRVHVQDDSVNAFYNRALQGYPFVYAKHDLPDILYLSLKELSPYPVCIIHSEGRYGPANSLYGKIKFDSTLVNLRRYLKAGGKLILAGRHIIQPVDDRYFPLPSPLNEGEFAYDILHIDSMLSPVWYYCGQEEFIGTNSTLLSEFTDLEIDTARVNLSYPKDRCDLQGRLPLIGYFVPLYPEEVIYTFNSAHDTSDFEGRAIGMRHIGDDYKVYFLDFPLHYVKEEQSVPLLHKILAEFGLLPTEVEEELVTLPQDFSLGQNYPNPFNPTTTIQFRLGSLESGEPIPSTLIIYNILGQKVRVLLDKEIRPGRYEVVWDGKDDRGKEVSSGIYFYQLKAGDYRDIKKMVLLR
jgi:hypothetical protein